MALKASERASLMKEIGTRLSKEEWPFIDSTLRAFSLPTEDSWDGTPTTYVLHMIGKASDESLLELAEYVGFQLSPKRNHLDLPFWRKGMLRLFIGHLSSHRGFAAELQTSLLEYGISSFVAHNDIEPTREWQDEIEAALESCDSLVGLMHAGFHGSKWTDQEIGFAMDRGVPVFAIRCGQIPYGFIARFQAFNGNGKSAIKIARELFEAFLRNKQTQRRMTDALVGLFAESYSFARAKALMGYLEETPVWDPSYPARLRSAVKHNPQVFDSFGVANRVDKLIKRWSKT